MIIVFPKFLFSDDWLHPVFLLFYAPYDFKVPEVSLNWARKKIKGVSFQAILYDTLW